MHKVSLSTIIKVLLKSIIIPIVVVFGLSKFNLFEYIAFIPKDYQYEVGLTVYLAVLETVVGLIESWMEQKKAKIMCIFYISESDKNISNTPLVICDNDMGVANIKCHLEVSGNLKRIRSCTFKLELPSWLTAQINVQDTVLKYEGNTLIGKFDRMLPRTGTSNILATYNSKIALIKNSSGDNMTIDLKPEICKNIGITFVTNGFRIQNGV